MASVRNVTICIKPSPSQLVDEPAHITVHGLDQHQRVAVTALAVEHGSTFVSYGLYEAGNDGTVDLDTMPSVGGTYTGVEPMGFIWSLKQAPGQKPGLRLLKRDVEQPLTIKLTVLSGHWTSTSHVTDHPHKLAQVTLYRHYKAPDVVGYNVRHGRLRGKLFVPPGDGPFPGVIDMFGTAGGLVEMRSALLASRGFISLALAYFDYEDLPLSIELNMEYFEEAIVWLANHPLVLKNGIGVVGVSKGAGLALQMAVMSNLVKAVVSINTLLFHSTGIHFYQGKEQYVVNNFVFDNCYETDEGTRFGAMFDIDEKDREAVIQIEKSPTAHFLFIVGEDDLPVDPSHTHTLVARMPPEQRRRITVLSYPAAGHLIEPPFSPHCRSCYAKLFSGVVVYGGETKQHSYAQLDAWNRTLQFLREHLTVANHGFYTAASSQKLQRYPESKL